MSSNHDRATAEPTAEEPAEQDAPRPKTGDGADIVSLDSFRKK